MTISDADVPLSLAIKDMDLTALINEYLLLIVQFHPTAFCHTRGGSVEMKFLHPPLHWDVYD